MRYGVLFTENDFKQRTDLPDMENLPDKCCANCDHWIECTNSTSTGEESKGYGGCPMHGNAEWDAFTWADDVCELHIPLVNEEPMMEFYNKHYISIDDQNRITNGFSDAFRQPTDTDICINEQGGYQFRLFPGGEENPNLFDWEHMIPLYKYEDGQVVKRTTEEIEADIAAIPVVEPQPTQLDKVEAQSTYTAMMTDTLLGSDVMTLSLDTESPMFGKVSKWYKQGLWNNAMLYNAVDKNIITAEEFETITGTEYSI